MTPKPHVCSICKKEVVWNPLPTDCLPAICYLCNDVTKKQGDTARREYRTMVQDAVKLVSKRDENDIQEDSSNV